MAYFEVQQWVALPIILEHQMGDTPPSSRPLTLNIATTGLRDGTISSTLMYRSPDNSTPFYSQLNGIQHDQPRSDFRTPTHATTQYQYPDHGSSQWNMSSMAGALAEYTSFEDSQVNTHSVPQTVSDAAASTVAFQLGQNMPLLPHAPGNLHINQSYGPGFIASPYQHNYMPTHTAHHGAYGSFAPAQGQVAVPTNIPASFQNYPQTSQYTYFAPPYESQGQAGYDRRASLTNAATGTDFPRHDNAFFSARMASNTLSRDQGLFNPTYGLPFSPGQGAPRTGSMSSIPRGPPRKPKQSGHALWVGNLPPGTTVVALKDYFSREATKDIESLFLISKSNCAFVNYRTEVSCSAAMHRFHDSRFNGVRLVCRLRRSSAPASGVPTAPSAMLNGQPPSDLRPPSPKQEKATEFTRDSVTETPVNESKGEVRTTAKGSNKYFIVKSLTLQDLELSVRNGIWATQSHNEDALNKAFHNTENVYLIFSANKSGEYFGYARMASPIAEDASELIQAAPKNERTVDATYVPKSIPTMATEWAPRGRIIDDSARGTIFWEAELSESEGEEETLPATEAQQVEGDISATTQSWGKPFMIQWVSTNRLPFYRTRGLLNPWNANREVKIARDGTELEPSVGERLVQMFHRIGPPDSGAVMSPPTYGGSTIPQMRPF